MLVLQQQLVKPSLESIRLAEQAVNEEIEGEESNAPLKDSWIALGHQLEMDGIPKDQVCTIACKLVLQYKAEKMGIDVKELKVSGYFYRVFGQNGWLNPFYQHGDATLGERLNTSSVTIFEEENNEWINLIDGYRDFLLEFRTILKKQSFETLIPEKEKKDTKFILSSLLQRARDRINLKQKVAPAHYSLLFRDNVGISASALSSLFYLHVRERETLTGKQVRRIARLLVSNIPTKYEPVNAEEAESLGFSGEACPYCNCYRTDITRRVVPHSKVSWMKSHTVRQILCFQCDKPYDAPKLDDLNGFRQIKSEIDNSDW